MSDFQTDEFLFIGRTFEEYCQFFDLAEADVAGETILDCPAGPASFAAEAGKRGATVFAGDIYYAEPVHHLEARCQADIEHVTRQHRKRPDQFSWSFYGDIDTRRDYLEAAAETFLDDFRSREAAGRYLPLALPWIPFPDDRFSLVLSAHFLFLYHDRLDYEFHRDAIDELLRVAKNEIRIFPIVGLDSTVSEHLKPILATLEDRGVDCHLDEVPFEFQRGATRMLRLGV